jgi:hypothetical protein
VIALLDVAHEDLMLLSDLELLLLVMLVRGGKFLLERVVSGLPGVDLGEESGNDGCLFCQLLLVGRLELFNYGL